MALARVYGRIQRRGVHLLIGGRPVTRPRIPEHRERMKRHDTLGHLPTTNGKAAVPALDVHSVRLWDGCSQEIIVCFWIFVKDALELRAFVGADCRSLTSA